MLPLSGPGRPFLCDPCSCSRLPGAAFEKNADPGASLLLAGSGQCNITHDGEIREFVIHYGDHGKFVKPALLSFTNRELMEFFIKRGLAMQTEEDGKVFPSTRRSADILEILIAGCRKQGVTIRCNEPVEGITRAGGLFTVTTATGKYFFTAVAITTGGASYPQCGTTGDGYRIAASLGQPVTEIGPALTPLLIRPFPFAALMGMSFAADAVLGLAGRKKNRRPYRGCPLHAPRAFRPGILDASRGSGPASCPALVCRCNAARGVFCGSLRSVQRKIPAGR